MATAEALPAAGIDKPADASAAGGSVTGLVTGIINDAQTLLKQQADMLKSEVREDFKRSKRAAEFGAVGIVFTTVGVLGLITALAYLLEEQFKIPMSASWGIVGGLFAVIGVASSAFSYVLLERFNPLPDKTFNALKENITWQTR